MEDHLQQNKAESGTEDRQPDKREETPEDRSRTAPASDHQQLPTTLLHKLTKYLGT